jgi:magnesium chelatase family protein
MTSRILRDSCPLDDVTEAALVALVEQRHAMSARSIDRVIKVARTVADLYGKDRIDAGDLAEACGFRAVDPLADVPRVDPRFVSSGPSPARQAS